MTTHEIIKQTETLSPDEQKSLISFLVLKYINPDKKQNLMQLFYYRTDFDGNKNDPDDIYNSIVAEQFLAEYSKEDDIYNSIDEICGSGKGLWKEDAQVYINKLRDDDRAF